MVMQQVGKPGLRQVSKNCGSRHAPQGVEPVSQVWDRLPSAMLGNYIGIVMVALNMCTFRCVCVCVCVFCGFMQKLQLLCTL